MKIYEFAVFTGGIRSWNHSMHAGAHRGRVRACDGGGGGRQEQEVAQQVLELGDHRRRAWKFYRRQLREPVQRVQQLANFEVPLELEQ